MVRQKVSQQNGRSQNTAFAALSPAPHVINILNLLFPVAVTKSGKRGCQVGCKQVGSILRKRIHKYEYKIGYRALAVSHARKES